MGHGCWALYRRIRFDFLNFRRRFMKKWIFKIAPIFKRIENTFWYGIGEAFWGFLWSCFTLNHRFWLDRWRFHCFSSLKQNFYSWALSFLKVLTAASFSAFLFSRSFLCFRFLSSLSSFCCFWILSWRAFSASKLIAAFRRFSSRETKQAFLWKCEYLKNVKKNLFKAVEER